ncbi:protein FAM43A-like [Limulus polyphemus]|uniref:Protein FAM43A-like n=1 Tax=Limulus polyphemus TaxID=6850 RepID=A0ABM1BDK4_LIMPO|nr:protein FAM43A-like [Limulus polyphemus]
MALPNKPFSPSNVKRKLKFWNKKSVLITEYDPTYKVIYLGNVLTQWAKGESCVDKPLATLWKNYCSNVKHEITMKVTVCNSGIKAVTKEHGLTEYWANRITFCTHHPQYPRIFCWVYRHEGRRMKQELRCHAVLCGKEEKAQTMAVQLNQKLSAALQEFRREKISRQKARLSLANSIVEHPSLPRRKQLLITGTVNFRPPMERSRSAPKLTSIDEIEEELDEDDDDFEDIEEYLNGSMVSEQESTSDIVPDDIDSLSDQYVVLGRESDSLDSDSVEELPNPRLLKPLNSIDEETDNISDESGYSEEKEYISRM